MHRLLTLTVSLLFITILLPATSASETVSSCYVAAGGGTFLGYGGAIHEKGPSNSAAGTSCPTGGAHLRSAGLYAHAAVSVSDDVWGGQAALQACAGHHATTTGPPAQDGCNEPGCGTQLLSPGRVFSEVSAFVFVFYVDADLEVCGGSIGTVTATFF